MLLHLAEQLEIPLRERNRLLSAAGYAPLYSQHTLDDPALAAARAAIEQLLKAKGASVASFTLYVVGEGLEKRSSDFAAEVAAQAAAAQK